MGCKASAFASQSECNKGGTFCTYDCNGAACLCNTSGAFIGMIVGIVFGLFIMIAVGCFFLRFYFAKQALQNGTLTSGVVIVNSQPAPWNAANNTNNYNNNNGFVVAGQPIQYGFQQQQQQQPQNFGYYNNNNNANNFETAASQPPPPPPPAGAGMPGFVTMQNVNNSPGYYQ